MTAIGKYRLISSPYAFILTFVLAMDVCQIEGQNKTKLILAGFVPTHPNSSWSGSGMIPAIELALDDVNNRSDILQDYELLWEWKDDECDAGRAAYVLCQHVYNGSQKIMILGGGCSVSTAPVAAFSWYFNMLQISYAASSPELSDKSKYPLFLRTMQSEAKQNAARIAIMKHFEWTHVATLYQNEKFFGMVNRDLIERMKENDIVLLTSMAIDYYPTVELGILKERGSRIIAVHAYKDFTRPLFCLAYRLGMYGPRYAWMVPGWYSVDWWKESDSRVNCTTFEMKKVVESVILTVRVPNDLSSKRRAISGETFEHYEKRYLSRLHSRPEYDAFDFNREHGYAYDAVWAIALGLNSSIDGVARMEMKDSNGTSRPKRLDDFTYGDSEMRKVFHRSILSVSFTGVTGQVSFNQFGDRIGNTAIYQIQDGKITLLGGSDQEGNMTLFRPFQWQGDDAPNDGHQHVLRVWYLDDNVFWAVVALSIVGVFVALALLIFNIKKRGHGFVKLSSPRMNNMTLVGALLVNLSVISGVMQDCSYLGDDTNRRTIFCVSGKWLLSIGFSLSFGAMFAKTWRVHRIISRLHPMTEQIQDEHLITFVICLALVDVALFTAWQLVDPCQSQTKNFVVEISENSIKTVTQGYECVSTFIWWWSGALIAEKGLLLLFGCFLAYEVRNVKVNGLNDSRQIGISIYNILLSSIIGVAVKLTLTDKASLQHVMIDLLVFFCIVSTLSMMFIPKIFVVLKDTSGADYRRRRNVERACLSVGPSMVDVSSTPCERGSDATVDTSTM
ncbi:gamma-aminobutyric acid type B receptor subunit 2-like [Ptychodera flava]|uniref:gamma-aminobutyric acid type B receptor subunit 2-like n=1 Tax=Ptychodera flava TaxID=63121 RepID=UPI00396A7969